MLRARARKTAVMHLMLPVATLKSEVCEDALYTSKTTFEEDLSFSPRNWLHRHRLTFLDSEGIEREVHCPLPQDLEQSLQNTKVPQLAETYRRFLEAEEVKPVKPGASVMWPA